MAGPIFANESSTIDTEKHWLIVLAGIMDDLIPGALQEGGIDRNHRSATAHRDPRCGCNGMLLSNANVIETIWICSGELVEAGSCWHACGDRYDPSIGCCGGNYFSSEEGRVVLSLWRGRLWHASTLPVRVCWNTNLHLRQRCAVEGDWIRFGRTISTTLLRAHMHDHRTWHGECRGERRFHLYPIMAI